METWKTCEKCGIYSLPSHFEQECTEKHYLDKWREGNCPIDNKPLKNGYFNCGWSMTALNVCSMKCFEKAKAMQSSPQLWNINFYVNEKGVTK